MGNEINKRTNSMNATTRIIRKFPGTEGIFLVYHMFANIYIIESDQGLMIVDTGLAGTTWKILRIIQRMGYKPEEVTSIILTHAHLDHFGSAASLKKKTGAQVLGHHADVPSYEKGGIGSMPGIIPQGAKINHTFQGRFLGAPPVVIDKELSDGDLIGEWTIIHTPGHTPGTINLYSESRKLIITGGWAIPSKSQIEKSKYRNPFVGYISSNPGQLDSSRKRLSNLEFDTLLCSHFPPRLFPYLARQLKAMGYFEGNNPP
jgi:glyoxylase-like metal-dependent hydrolase (beta-lactamase superfamily II)